MKKKPISVQAPHKFKYLIVGLFLIIGFMLLGFLLPKWVSHKSIDESVVMKSIPKYQNAQNWEPIYSPSSLIGIDAPPPSSHGRITFSTTDPINEVLQYYSNYLSESGWKVTVEKVDKISAYKIIDNIWFIVDIQPEYKANTIKIDVSHHLL